MAGAPLKAIFVAIALVVGASGAAQSEAIVGVPNIPAELREILKDRSVFIRRCCLRPCWARDYYRLPDELRKRLRRALRRPIGW